MRFDCLLDPRGKKSFPAYLTTLTLRKWCLFTFKIKPDATPWPETVTKAAEEASKYLKLPETMYYLFEVDDVNQMIVVCPPLSDKDDQPITGGDRETQIVYEEAIQRNGWPITLVPVEPIEWMAAWNPVANKEMLKTSGDKPIITEVKL